MVGISLSRQAYLNPLCGQLLPLPYPVSLYTLTDTDTPSLTHPSPLLQDGRGSKKPASQDQAMSELVEAVTNTKPDGFTPTIIKQDKDYLYVEYQSPTFGVSAMGHRLLVGGWRGGGSSVALEIVLMLTGLPLKGSRFDYCSGLLDCVVRCLLINSLPHFLCVRLCSHQPPPSATKCLSTLPPPSHPLLLLALAKCLPPTHTLCPLPPSQFIDDVEFFFPKGDRSLVEYRSASRIGESDGE